MEKSNTPDIDYVNMVQHRVSTFPWNRFEAFIDTWRRRWRDMEVDRGVDSAKLLILGKQLQSNHTVNSTNSDKL